MCKIYNNVKESAWYGTDRGPSGIWTYQTLDWSIRFISDRICNSAYKHGLHSPHYIKDIEVLENVQKSATKLVPKLRKFSYPKTTSVDVFKSRLQRIRDAQMSFFTDVPAFY